MTAGQIYMLYMDAKNVTDDLSREQGRRKPTGPARALLRILEADTEQAILALHPKRG